MMDQELKDQLLGRFREYLDYVGSGPGEPLPQGQQIDLLTLFNELAALKNEVKLESRQVRQALEGSQTLIDELRESNRQVNSELARSRRAEAELGHSVERPLLLEILELRDRMEASLKGLGDFHPPGLLGVRKTQRFVRSVREGMEIGLRRLDEVLARYQVRAIAAAGARMEPERMKVIGIEHRDDREDGVVLTEVRTGFLRSGEVLRLAEVIVNKRQDES